VYSQKYIGKVHHEDRNKLKGASKLDKYEHKVDNFAMWLKYSKKECSYHIVKYAHANVILNKNLGKF